MTDSRIGPRIRAAREACGITQAELGRRVGLEAAEMWKVETGRKGLKIWRLKAIATVLNVTVDSLIEDVPTERAS